MVMKYAEHMTIQFLLMKKMYIVGKNYKILKKIWKYVAMRKTELYIQK